MATTPTTITGVDFATIFVKDFDAAVEFYGTKLGLPQSARYGTMNGVEFETGNLTLSVVESAAIGREFERSGHPIALRVDDVAAARDALAAQGVEFFGDIIDSGVCHMAFFADPDGNALMFHHRYAPRSS